ncbi:hypothetical protein [Spirillospora sp. NPDC048824]|uniref:hypothetical protein n=1 Tax=Spirillospora sp. NPDC048824 TaxID=3364526 RepID=UPI003719BA85
MMITDRQVAMLRAQLTGRMTDFQQLVNRMDSKQETDSFDALVTAAFFEAVHRRFMDAGKPAGDAEVIEFVVAARKRSENAPDIVPPDVGEMIINLALGKLPLDANRNVDNNTSFKAKIFLLQVLVGDEEFTEPELEEFLARIREMAEENFE